MRCVKSLGAGADVVAGTVARLSERRVEQEEEEERVTAEFNRRS